METFKRKFYTWTTGHSKLVVTAFLIVAVIGALLWSKVDVNYDIKDYLPAETHSTVAIKVMEEEYEEGVPNARVMIPDVTVPEALEYKEKMLAVDGVDAVTWLDDSVSTTAPLAMADQQLIEQYYKNGNALFQLTIDKEKILTAVADVRDIAGEEAALTGDAVSTEVATVSTLKEIPLLCVLAVGVVLLILIFATASWIEPLIILVSLGIAILINAGTNLMFGSVSFVTNGSGNLLLLAVSLDYSVFLIHRFHECREELDDPREAMVEALCRSTSSILSSGLTTVIGFMALVLMRFLLGPDLGLASAKGVLLCLFTVFVFLPALMLIAYRWVEKTRHRPLMPGFTKLGKLVTKMMIPMVCIFVLIIAPAFLASNANDYYYGASKIFGTDTKFGQDMEATENAFGENDNYALLVPKGELASEKAMSAELQQLDPVTGVLSYVDTVGSEIPVEFIPEDMLAQLNSDEYTRMVISADIPQEGPETYALIEDIRDTAQKYYPDEYYLAGAGSSYYDLMKTISADMLKVNLVAIAAVYLILVVMMRSLLLPVLLVLSIETAIWLNVAVPYFAGDTVFYISYLIISAIQLGATVDYAILMTDRYRECRETLDKKEAVIETVASSVPSILVSGLALTIVGTMMGYISSHGILAMLGIFLGRGALLSMIIVIFVLPGLLYLFDKLYINRGKGKMKNKKVIAVMTSLMLAVAVFTPAVSQAATAGAKEEVVYGNLNHDGSVAEIYAVNIFETENITDYGEYTEVRNLTTSDKIKVDGDKITVKASETPFYYEGIMEEAQLPWNIDIDYALDGAAYDAPDLAGKSGKLRIDISVAQNGAADSFFYKNYALQITMALDSNFCRNIQAEGATIANVGSDKQLTYTVLPGQGTDISVIADVVDFSMTEISINGIKLEMDVDVDTSQLESEAAKLEDGTAQLDEGAGQLQSGSAALAEGTQQLSDGIAELRANVSGDAWKALMKANGLDVDQLKNVNATIAQQIKLVQDELKKLEPELQDSEELKKIYETCDELITAAWSLFYANEQVIAGTEMYLDEVNDQLGKVEEGVSDLDAGAEQLADGAGQLKSGTSQLKEGTAGIDEKISGEIDSMKDSITGSDEVRSFISDKNTNVESVQFVLKTDAIKITETEAEESEPEPEKSFWQKLMDLFK